MFWTWLCSWRLRPRLRHWQIVMYTRHGCHLCEEAWHQLEQARRRHGFSLTQVDVDSDPELIRQHGEQVPVVAINGRIRFRGRINPILFNRLVRAGK